MKACASNRTALKLQRVSTTSRWGTKNNVGSRWTETNDYLKSIGYSTDELTALDFASINYEIKKAIKKAKTELNK